MKTIPRAMVILGLLIGCGISAMATDITWTLNNVAFNDGNVATGSFTTSSDLSDHHRSSNSKRRYLDNEGIEFTPLEWGRTKS